MPGFMPGIHVFRGFKQQGVDGRDKPGHDELGWRCPLKTYSSILL
jgi:hypothetical protein